MSANCFAEDIVNSRIAGMNEHLTKPLDEKKQRRLLLPIISPIGKTVKAQWMQAKGGYGREMQILFKKD